MKDGLNLSSSLQRANGLGNRSTESVVEDYVNQFIGRSAPIYVHLYLAIFNWVSKVTVSRQRFHWVFFIFLFDWSIELVLSSQPFTQNWNQLRLIHPRFPALMSGFLSHCLLVIWYIWYNLWMAVVVDLGLVNNSQSKGALLLWRRFTLPDNLLSSFISGGLNLSSPQQFSFPDNRTIQKFVKDYVDEYVGEYVLIMVGEDVYLL